MSYTLQLGVMKSPLPSRAATGKEALRLAILGDFSGRAAAGKLETGDQLAARKPIVVDVDPEGFDGEVPAHVGERVVTSAAA